MCVSLGNQTKTGTFLDVSEIGTRRMARTTFTRNPRAKEKWRENHGAYFRDTLNYTVKFRGIYTVGWKYRRKTPNTVG